MKMGVEADVGLAFSGGGIPAFLCTMCVQAAMLELGLYEGVDKDLFTVATVSGGTLGSVGSSPHPLQTG